MNPEANPKQPAAERRTIKRSLGLRSLTPGNSTRV